MKAIILNGITSKKSANFDKKVQNLLEFVNLTLIKNRNYVKRYKYY